MDLYLPPKPSLWLPTKPAIIRAAELPKTPAEARGIGHNGGLPWGLVPPLLALGGVAPGSHPGFSTEDDEGPLTFTFVEEVAGIGTSINLPTSIQDEDVCVAFNGCSNNSTTVPTAVTPTLFTATGINTFLNTNPANRMMVSYRKCDGSEAGDSITGISATAILSWRVVVFRPSKPFTTINLVGASGNSSTGAPTNQSLTLAAQNAPVIALGVAWGASATPLPAGTLVTNGVALTETQTRMAAYYELQNTAPADRTFTNGDSGTKTAIGVVALACS